MNKPRKILVPGIGSGGSLEDDEEALDETQN
jgi:hypothetical protein